MATMDLPSHSIWNYVVTAQKPSCVTHASVGKFTDPQACNLILGKGTHIEIYSFTSERLQLIVDVPVHGRISALQLFQPSDGKGDSLFVLISRCQAYVFQWNPKISWPTIRWVEDCLRVWSPPARARNNGQIGIIDPACRLVALSLYENVLQVIPLTKGRKRKSHFIRLDEDILDMKFLYNSKTTLVLLQDLGNFCIRMVEINMEMKTLVDVVKVQHFDFEPHLLIPVSQPLCGVLVVGKNGIAYYNGKTYEAVGTESSVKAYGRVDHDCSKYLLGDDRGLLSLLELIHDRNKNKVRRLKIVPLGTTCIASTISYLDKEFVFIGSSCGDSQLLKLKLQPDANASSVELVESFLNLGPITDLCVVDRGQIVTCSGAYKDGSIRTIRSGICISKDESETLAGINGMWLLGSSTEASFPAFLVISFAVETKVFKLSDSKSMAVLEETLDERGFYFQLKTLFCNNAIYNQFLQVTTSSVRLIDSKTGSLNCEWRPISGSPIILATGNADQVLLAMEKGKLAYFRIFDGRLVETELTRLQNDISCLGISCIGDDSDGYVAAVGTWTDRVVRILSLPKLELITKQELGKEHACSVLFCLFEGISYLLCGLADGRLVIFKLNKSTYELTEKREVNAGTRPIKLQTFSFKNTTHVLAVSDQSIVIYSLNKKLFHSSVDPKEVNHFCSFNCEAFRDRVAIATDDELIMGTMEPKIFSKSIPLQEHAVRICHQKESGTYAIISWKVVQDAEMHFVRLLDEESYGFLSTFPLEEYEHGCSLVSSSFSSCDHAVYYCVGTAYVLPAGNEPIKGRILVFAVEDRELRLIAQRETKGAVYCLNNFHGKLLAAVSKSILLYQWTCGTHELHPECGHRGFTLALYVQTRGNLIVVGDVIKSISVLIYKAEENVIEERARDQSENWMSAVEILHDDIYLGADIDSNLFTVSGVASEEQHRLRRVGRYHLGELVQRFQHGSLTIDSQIPTIIFGTHSGMIGVIASLPREKYDLLEKLQSNLRSDLNQGRIIGPRHDEWRGCEGWDFPKNEDFSGGVMHDCERVKIVALIPYPQTLFVSCLLSSFFFSFCFRQNMCSSCYVYMLDFLIFFDNTYAFLLIVMASG
nr:DNA damage-binding protein 1 [Arachis hypogaea]